MLKNIFKFLAIELLIVLVILGLTKDQLLFHTSHVEPLTEELIKKVSNLDYNQYYNIDHPMRYLINIESEDTNTQGTLLWPTEPFGRFLLLIPGQSEELKKQQNFSGRLIRCIYKCSPSNMYIEMFGFVEMIENHYPKLKGKYSKLPSIIFDTSQQPGGIKAYFTDTHYYWIGFSFTLTLGGIWLLKKILLG